MKNYGFIIKQKAVNVAGVKNGVYIPCEDEVCGYATKEEAERAAENRIDEIFNDEELNDDGGYEDDDFDYEIVEHK